MTTNANVPHNVLGMAVKSVYLTDPMNKLPDDEDKTEPQDLPESGAPTSAPVDKQEETYKKRYDDIKRHYDSTKASYESKVTELTNKVSELSSKLLDDKVTSPKFPKTPEEYKDFKEKYPELAANMETAAMIVANSQSQVLTDKLKQLEEVQNAIRTREGIMELKKYHPDFEEIRTDPKFIDWFERQRPLVQQLIQSSDVNDISEGLNKYKQDTGIKTKAENKKNLTRDVNVPQRVQIGEGEKRTYSDSMVNKMDIREFEKLQEDIRLAQREGRYLYNQ